MVQRCFRSSGTWRMIGGQRKRRLRPTRAFPYKWCIVPETYRMKTLAARIVLITEVSSPNQKRSGKKNSPETAAFIFPPTSILTQSPPRHPTWSSQTDLETSILNLSHLFIHNFESLVFRVVCYLVIHRPSSLRTSWASAFSFFLPFSAAAHAPHTHRNGTSHPSSSSSTS